MYSSKIRLLLDNEKYYLDKDNDKIMIKILS